MLVTEAEPVRNVALAQLLLAGRGAVVAACLVQPPPHRAGGHVELCEHDTMP